MKLLKNFTFSICLFFIASLTFSCKNDQDADNLINSDDISVQLKALDKDPLVERLHIVLNDFKVNYGNVKFQSGILNNQEQGLKVLENFNEINSLIDKLEKKYSNFEKLVIDKKIQNSKNSKIKDGGVCSFWQAVEVAIDSIKCAPTTSMDMSRAEIEAELQSSRDCLDSVYYSIC